MSFKQWLIARLEDWLGIPELRRQNKDLEQQLSALSKLQSEAAEASEAQDRRITEVISVTNVSVMEAEERMLIRVTALERQLSDGNYTKNEADAPGVGNGGYVPWTERKRRAEQAASDPSKWIKKQTAQQET